MVKIVVWINTTINNVLIPFCKVEPCSNVKLAWRKHTEPKAKLNPQIIPLMV